MDRDNILIYGGIGLVLAVLIGIALYGAISNTRNHNRLMQQCLDDGKKEYECVALLKRNDETTVIPVPIIIPMSR